MPANVFVSGSIRLMSIVWYSCCGFKIVCASGESHVFRTKIV